MDMSYLPGLPWSATETASGKGKVIDCDGFSVAVCNGCNYTESREHAAYITNAANSHDALVEALEAIMDAVKRCEENDYASIVDEFTEEMGARAIKALADAKGADQ